MRRWFFALFAFAPAVVSAYEIPAPAAIDAEVARVMRDTGSKGLAIAVIDDGKPVHVPAHGVRNAAGRAMPGETARLGAPPTQTEVP